MQSRTSRNLDSLLLLMRSSHSCLAQAETARDDSFTVVSSHLFTRRGRRSVLRGLWAYFRPHHAHERWLHSLRLLYRMRVHILMRTKRRFGAMVKHREARLYVDGEEAFDRLSKLFRRARHAILIRMFIWKDDHTGRSVAQQLLDAADRGVRVHITKDVTGDMFELDSDFTSTKESAGGVWRRFWSHPNITAETVNAYDHGKAFIIDNEILLLSGMNIADEYRYEWHDFLVELRGERFVEDYLAETGERDAKGPAQLVINGAKRHQVRPVLTRLLQSAKREIILEQAYFSDPGIVDLLAERSHEEIAIRIILPRDPDIHHSANTLGVSTLLQKGDPRFIQVFEYPGMLHAKLILVDRERAFTGSANMVTFSLDSMGEVNVLLSGKHTKVLRRIREVVRRDLLKSTPMLGPPQLKWLTRIFAWLGL